MVLFTFPEKLIPLMILNTLEGKLLPVYGEGLQIRDWLFVEAHIREVYKVLTEGKIGETYNIDGHNERANIEVVHFIYSFLEEFAPNKSSGVRKYEGLITFVSDRPRLDKRYAIDDSKIIHELG